MQPVDLWGNPDETHLAKESLKKLFKDCCAIKKSVELFINLLKLEESELKIKMEDMSVDTIPKDSFYKCPKVDLEYPESKATSMLNRFKLEDKKLACTAFEHMFYLNKTVITRIKAAEELIIELETLMDALVVRITNINFQAEVCNELDLLESKR